MVNNKNPRVGAKEMMNSAAIGKGALCTIDVTQVEEESFPCPKCGTMISPDDLSDESYKIVDTKMVNGQLAELIVSCGTCRTRIKLTGFQQMMEGLPSK